MIAPNPPFEDEPMKKAFRVIVSSFQALSNIANKSYHKRLRILESMFRVNSPMMLLDLECYALVLDIFHHLLAPMQDDHPPPLFAHIKSILVGIPDEADDLLLKFLISTLSLESSYGQPFVYCSSYE